MKGQKKAFLAGLITGFVIAAAVFALGMSRDNGVWRCFYDGFFVAAVLLLGVALLKTIRNKGVFDVAEYGIKRVVEITIPVLQRGEREDMAHFRERKGKARKGAGGLFMAGGVYAALTLIFALIYHLVV